MRRFHACNPLKTQQCLATAVPAQSMEFHRGRWKENALKCPPAASAVGRAGLQGKRVELAAHLGLERLVDDLVLLHARLAAEGFGDDRCGVVVAVAGKIADR